MDIMIYVIVKILLFGFWMLQFTECMRYLYRGVTYITRAFDV